MNAIRDRKKRLALAVLLAMLITVLAFGGSREADGGVTGFWGMLYPRYCFSEGEARESRPEPGFLLVELFSRTPPGCASGEKMLK